MTQLYVLYISNVTFSIPSCTSSKRRNTDELSHLSKKPPIIDSISKNLPSRTPLIALASAISLLNMLFYCLMLCISLYRIDYSLAPHSVFYRIISLLLPPILWILATNMDIFSYRSIRKIAFIMVA